MSAWRPERSVEIVAGTPPGGGLDRTARALAQALEGRGQIGVPVTVRNVPGDGARRAWQYVDSVEGDPHVLCVSHPNLTTDQLMGLAAFGPYSYTPIAILYTEYIAFAVRHDSTYRTPDDLLAAMQARRPALRVALSTALGNPNHIALAQVVQHAGGDATTPAIRVFDSALDAVSDVEAGNADVAAVTAASTLTALAAGRVRLLAVSSPQRLGGRFEGIPTWREQHVDCAIGAWRGVSGARGIEPPHVAFWEQALRQALDSREWRDQLARQGWSDSYADGAVLHALLAEERDRMAAALSALGLIPRGST